MRGWRLVVCLFLAMLLLNSLLFALGGDPVSALRLTIRSTARISLALFCLAFGASAFYRLWPGAWSRWLLTNRRSLGLSFALSHLIHLIVVILFARTDSALFHALTQPAGIAFGGFSYLVIAAMAATSFDGAVRWLGPNRWRWLHLIGGYEIWLQFMVSMGRRAAVNPSYVPFVILLLSVLAVRIIAMRKRIPQAAPLAS